MIRLRKIWRRWRAEGLLYCLLVALAGAIVMLSVAHRLLGWPWWMGIFLLGACLGIVLWVFPVWRMRMMDVVSYLDRRMPELEESCGLLLRPSEELGVLERLQVTKVEQRISALPALPGPMRVRLFWGAGFVVVAALVGWMVDWVWIPETSKTISPAVVRGPVPAGVRRVVVRITPPAYTGRAVRSLASLSIEAEQGALVSWELETEGAIDTAVFIFNDTAVRPMHHEHPGRWSFSCVAVQPGFYQLRIGAGLSGLYRFDVIKDEPPKVSILRPKPYTVIDYGESMLVPLQVELVDDYGISGSSVFATISSGRGEAVKFREQELHWGRAFSGASKYSLNRMLDLPSLGLRPGDELYFYCTARDDHGQETRSDTYIVSLADTAQLMSLGGIALPTGVRPEFFRSERQIIIETQQLLRAKDTMAVEAFRNKSNDLGMDQKLLRLRYGKFLGEEAEEGERGGFGSDTADAGAFGDATKILDLYSDKHDNAEDAGFLEPSVKAQLRATLSEMWKAELRFRLYQPRDALPFCYKALRLLKELQQRSRAYVAKTGVRLAPLNPDKRLTGELGGIGAPVQRLTRDGELRDEDILRMGLAVLESIRNGMMPAQGDLSLLNKMERKLAGEAAARPGRFLAGYEGIKRLTGTGGGLRYIRMEGEGATDIFAAERAIGLLLPAAEERPGVTHAPVDGGLGQLFFRYIK